MIQIQETIQKLRVEHARISAAISTLEKLESGYTPGRRGRKAMGAEERKQVSARMKRYWAGVRKAGAH